MKLFDYFYSIWACQFCGERGDNLKMVESIAGYGDTSYKYRYHTGCLYAVARNPEEHGHHKVDTALRILEAIEKLEYRKKSQEKRRKERNEELRRKAESHG